MKEKYFSVNLDTGLCIEYHVKYDDKPLDDSEDYEHFGFRKQDDYILLTKCKNYSSRLILDIINAIIPELENANKWYHCAIKKVSEV